MHCGSKVLFAGPGDSDTDFTLALAMKYVEATDPAKAKKIKDAQAGIDKEVDPEKAKAALEALEKTLRTGDIFADMQVKAALTAYGQNRGLYNDLKADSLKATGILDKNLAERRETSSQRWAELGQAWSDTMRSVGDAIRPATDAVAQGLTTVAHGLTTLSDKAPAAIMGLAGLAAGVSALLAARSSARVARGVFNVARGRTWGARRGGKVGEPVADTALPNTGNRVLDAGIGAVGKVFGAPASNDPAAGVSNEPQRVFVVNADAFSRVGGRVNDSGPAAPGSRRARRRRRRAGAMADARRAPGAKGSPPARVPAVHAPDMPAAAPKAPPVHLPVGGVTAFAGTAGLTGEVGGLASAVHSVRGVTKGLSKVPGGKVIDAIPGVLDVALNAQTQDEKAEGYGGLAGGAAGAWAGGATGAMMGAALGSVVPVLGTAVGGAVGGAIGMVLGGLGGESAGGWLGKRLFGEDKPAEVAEAKPQAKEAPKVEAPVIGAAVAKAPPAPEATAQGAAPGAVMRALDKESRPPAPTAVLPAAVAAVEKAKPEPAKVDQSFTFAPHMPITVHGDVKDPNQIIREAEPALRAMWDAFQREVAARQASVSLYDAADVA